MNNYNHYIAITLEIFPNPQKTGSIFETPWVLADNQVVKKSSRRSCS